MWRRWWTGFRPFLAEHIKKFGGKGRRSVLFVINNMWRTHWANRSNNIAKQSQLLKYSIIVDSTPTPVTCGQIDAHILDLSNCIGPWSDPADRCLVLKACLSQFCPSTKVWWWMCLCLLGLMAVAAEVVLLGLLFLGPLSLKESGSHGCGVVEAANSWLDSFKLHHFNTLFRMHYLLCSVLRATTQGHWLLESLPMPSAHPVLLTLIQ